MTPIEHYWPAEMLAQAFPDRYGHLAAKPAPSQGAAGIVQASPTKPLPYTVEPVTGGCHVIRPRFGGGAGIWSRNNPDRAG